MDRGSRKPRPIRLDGAVVKTDAHGEFVSATGFVVDRPTRWKPPARQRGPQPNRLLSVRRRTHGTRKRAGHRVVRRSSSRAGPDDGSGSSEPPGKRGRDHLLRDVADYLARVGQGAEREWLIEQISFLGYPAERVSAALSLAVAEGKAHRRVDDDGTEWIRGTR